LRRAKRHGTSAQGHHYVGSYQHSHHLPGHHSGPLPRQHAAARRTRETDRARDRDRHRHHIAAEIPGRVLMAGAPERMLDHGGAKSNVTPARKGWVERQLSLDARDPKPFEDAANFWRATAQTATVVMCVVMLGVLLYLARALLLPVLCAAAVGLTIGPLVG